MWSIPFQTQWASLHCTSSALWRSFASNCTALRVHNELRFSFVLPFLQNCALNATNGIIGSSWYDRQQFFGEFSLALRRVVNSVGTLVKKHF